LTDSKKSYYAVVPATVRYDENLPPNAKLLYGEITALCNSEGYCWASNKYFADLYGVSQRCIQQWLKKLIDRGYIQVEMFYKEGTKEVEKRFITILSTPREEIFTTYGKNFRPPNEKMFATPREENFAYNNTSFNNTLNNTNEYVSKSDKPTRTRFVPPSLEEVRAYCEERNKGVIAEKWYDHYSAVGWKVGRNPMKDWKAAVRKWEQNDYNSQAQPVQQKPQSEYDRFMSGLAEFVKESELNGEC